MRQVPPRAYGSDGPVWVTVEPHAGHSDDEIVETLRSAGAEEVSVLAPGFVSALASDDALSSVERIADVNVKARKETRSLR
jgi:hypothetical protein